MTTTSINAEHVLFVTGPVREQLYQHFRTLFVGRDDVEVRLDRRFAERRSEGRRQVRDERRRHDRRRHPPDWIVPPLDGV
jgi:hypothetical protein